MDFEQEWRCRAERAEERLEQAATVLAAEQHDRKAAEAEAARSRERLADAERAAEVHLARIEVLRGALEAVGADAQALKPEVQQVRHDVLDLMRERADLRKQLATATALVPEAELMERAAKYADIAQAHYLQGSTGGAIHHSHFKQKVADEETLDALATAIRARRGDGDGDGREEREGESDD